jgi:hypothetical protein
MMMITVAGGYSLYIPLSVVEKSGEVLYPRANARRR